MAQKRAPAKKTAKKAVAKKAPASRRSPRKSAPRDLNLRKGEKYVVLDGANIRHIADTNSENWASGWPMCGARPPSNTVFVDTAAKLPVCDNCKAAW